MRRPLDPFRHQSSNHRNYARQQRQDDDPLDAGDSKPGAPPTDALQPRDPDGQYELPQHRSASLHGRNRVEHRAETTESPSPCYG